MTVIDFTGAWAKFERAQRHLRTLTRKVSVYNKSYPIVFDSEPSPDGLSEDFYFRFVRPIPDDFGLILGDCVHNLRSALDHIAMALAIDNGVDPYDSTVYFPICDRPEDFFGADCVGSYDKAPPRGSGRYKVCKLSLDAQTFVEEMQPYHRRAEAWPLTEIQYLDNWDKHRAILPHAYRHFFTIELVIPGVTVEYISSDRIEDGAHYATIRYPSGYSGMKVKPPLAAGISVERSNRKGFLIIPANVHDHFIDQVRGICTEAERRFGIWQGVI